MNKKGFAISIILYSLVFLLITILFMILGILKTRYNVSDKTREAAVEGINSSDYAVRVFKRDLLEKKTRLPIWIDTMGTQDPDDNVFYVAPITTTGSSYSGYQNIVDNNYVWYSGKLWRIVALYPDGTMKLVTEDTLSYIIWGKTSEFNGSYIYQWLNEDFLDTLYNHEKIVENALWNYTADTGSLPSRPESLPNQKTIRAKVGLLNAYEVYNTRYVAQSPSKFNDNTYNLTQYNRPSSATYDGVTYLRAGDDDGHWYLITQHNTMNVKSFMNYRVGDDVYRNPISVRTDAGVRPSIVLKRNVIFKGAGTKSNPYTIIGDKKAPTYNTTLLNTRSSGEYVLFNNSTYRITEIESNKTYLVSELGDRTVLYDFASTGIWGKSTNTPYRGYPSASPSTRDYYADYYYNNIWYGSIPSEYKNMMVDGSFYQGDYSDTKDSYKCIICTGNSTQLNDITIKNCTKYTEQTGLKFVGKVGLPRIGQMFSVKFDLSGGRNYPLLPRKSLEYPGKYSGGITSISAIYRPVIALSPSVKITAGNGTWNSPFRISL